MNGLALLPYFPLLSLLLLAAYIDIRQRRIPNWLTFGMIFAGLLRGAMLQSPIGFGGAVAGMFVGGLPPFILFALGAMGAGDVKLLAAIGVWLGPVPAITIFIVECVVGMVIVLIQAVIQGHVLKLFRNTAALACSIAHQGIAASAENGKSFTSVDRPLPYAVPVFVATLLVLAARLGWRQI